MGGGGAAEPEFGTLATAVSLRKSSMQSYHERFGQEIMQRPLASCEGGHQVADGQRHQRRDHDFQKMAGGGAAKRELRAVSPHDAQPQRLLAKRGTARRTGHQR